MTHGLRGRGRAGLRFEDVRIGDGRVAARGSVVTIRYSLSLNRGERVQQDRDCTFRIGERRVVAALEYGVEGMRAGGVRRVRAGPHLGYGARGVPNAVPADAVLLFDILLLAVEPVADGGA